MGGGRVCTCPTVGLTANDDVPLPAPLLLSSIPASREKRRTMHP